MHILVAVASRHGGTREIAEAIGDELRLAGLNADVREADDVPNVDDCAGRVCDQKSTGVNMVAIRRFQVPDLRRHSVPGRRLLRLVLVVSAGLACTLIGRSWQLRWGATAEEASEPLLGDDLVPDPAYVTTRAVTVRTPPDAIWPWLAQMGQGRGGFYTYDWLEQIVGAAIHTASCPSCNNSP